MKRVAQFFKVSFENFAEAVKGDFPKFSDTNIQEIYDKILLPRRGYQGEAPGMISLRLFPLPLRRVRLSRFPREFV